MKRGISHLWVIGLLFVVAGCSPSTNKIGATSTGVRVAIMPEAHALDVDHDLQGARPEITEQVQNKDWPQAGYVATHLMPNAALSNTPQEIWTTSIGEGISAHYKILARPVAADGRIFVMDAIGHVTAVDGSNGDVLWDFETKPENQENDTIGGGLGVDDGRLFVTTGFGEVIALDVAKGSVVWRRTLSNPLHAAPTIAHGHVYVLSIDSQLQALDAKTGEILWHHNGISENASLMGASNPAAGEQNVIVSYSSGEIYDIRAENGRASWNYTLSTLTQVGALPAIADIRGLPVLDHGWIFAISHSGRVAAVEERSGDRVWEAEIGGINTPVVNGNAVFILNNDRQLVALTRDAGRVFWIHNLQRNEDPEDTDSDALTWVGPILAGNNLWLINSLGEAVAFSPATGEQVTTTDVGDPAHVAPVVANGILYVVTDEGHLVALK